MSEHTFKTIRDNTGAIIKMKASLSPYKDITVNSFNDKSYMHLSDVSKCFMKGGGFDLKKSKSVSLNRDEVMSFIQMSKKLPSLMDKVLRQQPYSQNDTTDSSSYDSDEDVETKTTKQKKQKRLQNDSDTESKSKAKSAKRSQKKRVAPYRKPAAKKDKTTAESQLRK